MEGSYLGAATKINGCSGRTCKKRICKHSGVLSREGTQTKLQLASHHDTQVSHHDTHTNSASVELADRSRHSQGGVVVIVHNKVLLALLGLLGDFNCSSGQVIVVIISFELITNTEIRTSASGTTASTTAATRAFVVTAALVASAATTAATTSGSLLGDGFLRVLLFLVLFFFVHALEFLDLLGKLVFAVVFVPLLLILNLLDLLIEFFGNDRGAHDDQTEPADQNDINIKGVIELNDLLLLFALSALSATNLEHSFSFGLGHGSLDLSILHLLGHLLFVHVTEQILLGRLGNSFGVLNEAGSDFEGVAEVDEVIASLELLDVGVGQFLDLLLSHLYELFPLLSILDGSFLLPGHPLDMGNLLVLEFVVVAIVPVLLAGLVLLGEQTGKLLLEKVDFLSDLVGLLLDISLLLLNGFHFSAENFNLLLETSGNVLLNLQFFPNLLLLRVVFGNFRFDLGEALSLRDGCLQDFNLLNELVFFSGTVKGSSLLLVIKMLDGFSDFVDSVVVFVHHLQEGSLLRVKNVQSFAERFHFVLQFSLLVIHGLELLDLGGEGFAVGHSGAFNFSAIDNLASLRVQALYLLTQGVNLSVKSLHRLVEVGLLGLLQFVLFGRQSGDFRLGSEHLSLPLGAIHVMELVDPRIFLLLASLGAFFVVPVVSGILLAFARRLSVGLASSVALLGRSVSLLSFGLSSSVSTFGIGVASSVALLSVLLATSLGSAASLATLGLLGLLSSAFFLLGVLLLDFSLVFSLVLRLVGHGDRFKAKNVMFFLYN